MLLSTLHHAHAQDVWTGLEKTDRGTQGTETPYVPQPQPCTAAKPRRQQQMPWPPQTHAVRSEASPPQHVRQSLRPHAEGQSLSSPQPAPPAHHTHTHPDASVHACQRHQHSKRQTPPHTLLLFGTQLLSCVITAMQAQKSAACLLTTDAGPTLPLPQAPVPVHCCHRCLGRRLCCCRLCCPPKAA